MNITTDDRGGYAVIAIAGRLTASGASLLRNAVSDLVTAGQPRIAVDLSGTEFVDSSGLGALIGGLKSARVAGGDLRIAAVPDAVRTVLHLTNLDRVLRDYPTPDAAFDEH
ncbi:MULTISPECIES: STAS domain-containing protein [unclassified Microbacterium]|uniref:STAS domain-containing protein n=1 Tax=unclassified Microbacterium TaxID=2609290 RepID=UPI000EA911DB|nr:MULTISPECIES: STAS domain-containing protein [unclassified Microbacterium]MBT2483837.1 STAS domain-containing protein [Microbacterium sp. ISL-108]RKN66819.1 anti-sigma factor antagonist [Microbacterium sp. CGR2]